MGVQICTLAQICSTDGGWSEAVIKYHKGKTVSTALSWVNVNRKVRCMAETTMGNYYGKHFITNKYSLDFAGDRKIILLTIRRFLPETLQWILFYVFEPSPCNGYGH